MNRPWVWSCITVLVLVLGLSRFVWIPDILAKRETVIGYISIHQDEKVEVVQAWCGDGYLTRVRHKLASGCTVHSVIDADSMKVWQARLEHQPAYGRVSIWIHRKHALYYYNLHSLSVGGETHLAQ